MIIIYSFITLTILFLDNIACVIVETEHGQLRGEILQAATGYKEYVSFKGIPYGKPPIGDLRFMAPQPPEPWSGIRNATEHGSICPQLINKIFQGNEDCLYLNVYTPDVTPKQLFPVMLFIHGGGFAKGSGNVNWYGPDYLMNENIVLVTINYRLAALGFLCLNNKEVPGNAGMKDQVAAMKWVQENIANFGGDPNKVTIFGQSAGAVCVALHNLSPMTKGLYKRSVAMSGVPLNDWALPFEPRRRAFKLGQQLGLWTRDDQKLVKFFKSLPAEKFFGTFPAILRAENPSNTLKQLSFTPVVETDYGAERFLTMNPMEALKHGKIHDVDLMLGHTAMEGFIYFILLDSALVNLYTNYTEMIVPRKILENIPPAEMSRIADRIHIKYFGDNPINRTLAKELVKLMSESSFNYGISKYANMFSRHRKTFMYTFSRVTNFPRSVNLNNNFGVDGATHNDDLLYVFYPDGFNVTDYKDGEDYKLLKKTCGLYANFAKYGNPTPNNKLGVKWPEYNESMGYYLDIDLNLTIGKHLNAESTSFWDSIYESAGLCP